jgi:DNA (cytosine-5)-methyltransferase 1
MNELALFAGAGGGILGGKLLGWRTVCAVEIEPYPASVLVARQNDGILPPFPIWDDVCTFDGKPWQGIVDVISGGFPCQDISSAGRGAGITGARSGLWKEFARIIGEVRPRFVLVENSPVLTSRGLGVVLGDLASMGYDAQWGVLGAVDAGAPHKRERIWIMAFSQNYGIVRRERGKIDDAIDGIKRYGAGKASSNHARVEKTLADTSSAGLQIGRQPGQPESDTETRTGMESEPERCSQAMADSTNSRDVWRDWQLESTQGQVREHRGSPQDGCREWWATEPDVGRVANGVAARVDRLKAIGNGQVPRVAATAFELLRERLNES